MNAQILDWLLEGPGYVRYWAYIDLLGRSKRDKDTVAARRAMVADPQVAAIVKEVAAWPGAVLSSHKSAGHLLHKLAFLADLGLDRTDPGISDVCLRVLERQSDQGPFAVLMNIPKHFGGTGRDQLAWALCDAPVLVYCLTAFGLGRDRRVCQ
ncbi:hypothetical protein FJY70_02165, partial [candidate division WOR-3 bacterium]|nr:hypothetical protein [candidate division WOR-3 bacterium]